jgi:hypothetical protein
VGASGVSLALQNRGCRTSGGGGRRSAVVGELALLFFRPAGFSRHRSWAAGSWFGISCRFALSTALMCPRCALARPRPGARRLQSTNCRRVPVGCRKSSVGSSSADPLLAKTFRGPWPSAAFLIRASFLVVWVPFYVSSFRRVLARGWHALPDSIHLPVLPCLDHQADYEDRETGHITGTVVDSSVPDQ